jgi:transcriptional regulator with XRE-family HTH domain
MKTSNLKKSHKIQPAAVEETLFQLGRNIRIARLRRQLRLEDLALKVGVSRYVMSDIEKGKATTAIGSYIGALWVLGLLEDVREIANPDFDLQGKALENLRLPRTAAKRKSELDNDF